MAIDEAIDKQLVTILNFGLEVNEGIVIKSIVSKEKAIAFKIKAILSLRYFSKRRLKNNFILFIVFGPSKQYNN